MHESLDTLMEQPINQSVITLKGLGCGNRNKHFVKSQPIFDAHRQHVWTFLIDLQAEVEFFTVLLIFSQFSSVIIGFYLL